MSEFKDCELECGAYGSYCKCAEEKARASECPPDACCSTAAYNYVDIVGRGCEGWLNLFFGEQCIAMISDVDLANKIRLVTQKRSR